MKKLLLVLALAAALSMLLAAPAFAEAPWAPTFRAQMNTAYVWIYANGAWWEATGDPGAPTLVVHDVKKFAEDDTVVKPADPIPANYDICLIYSWKGLNYGLIQKLPTDLLVTLSIPQLGIDLSGDASKACWSGPYLWDQYWVDATGASAAGFNEHLGTLCYANRWMLPLGKLPRGEYNMAYSEYWPHLYTGLEQGYIYDPATDDWYPMTTPYHVPPSTEEPVPWISTFRVK
jgi:hypothetical protein